MGRALNISPLSRFSRRRNPTQRIRSTRRRPVLGQKRLRGRARVSMLGGTLGDANYYTVQVRRAAKWITLAGFPRGEFGKARATEYGRLLARRYPRQSFRVFWPDALPTRKNPREIPVHKYGNEKWFSPADLRRALEHLNWNHGKGAIISISPTHYRVRKQYGTEKFSYHVTENGIVHARGHQVKMRHSTRKKNPAPRARRADGAAAEPQASQVNQAARLFSQFTGHPVTRARQVNLPRPKVGLAIGPVLGISYATTRDGKRENYLHEFRRGARPLLAASQDGRTLMLLGGGHRFTPRGIVDDPR